MEMLGRVAVTAAPKTGLSVQAPDRSLKSALRCCKAVSCVGASDWCQRQHSFTDTAEGPFLPQTEHQSAVSKDMAGSHWCATVASPQSQQLSWWHTAHTTKAQPPSFCCHAPHLCSTSAPVRGAQQPGRCCGGERSTGAASLRGFCHKLDTQAGVMLGQGYCIAFLHLAAALPLSAAGNLHLLSPPRDNPTWGTPWCGSPSCTPQSSCQPLTRPSAAGARRSACLRACTG